MAKKQLPTPEQLCKLLRYEPDTGLLFWRERAPDMFESENKNAAAIRWNNIWEGKPALSCVSSKGYLHGTIFYRHMKAHRVIWAMETGAWPVDQIDHTNHDRSNNRMENLREVTNIENSCNQKIRSNNTSGHMGVTSRDGGWRVRISVNGVRLHLGDFSEIEKAISVRKAAEIEHGFHKNHGAST